MSITAPERLNDRAESASRTDSRAHSPGYPLLDSPSNHTLFAERAQSDCRQMQEHTHLRGTNRYETRQPCQPDVKNPPTGGRTFSGGFNKLIICRRSRPTLSAQPITVLHVAFVGQVFDRRLAVDACEEQPR